jgi:fructosamine-3-kinase
LDYSKQFRELIRDPFEVPFSNFELDAVLEYFHAGNDVLHCLGKDSKHYVVKFARHKDSNFRNHVEILEALRNSGYTSIQTVIEHGTFKDTEYLVLSYVHGKRITEDLELYRTFQTMFCLKFGESIGRIHKLEIEAPKVILRKFHSVAPASSEDPELIAVNGWLNENKPSSTTVCFIHGDHHNANILWNSEEIECVLDWELAGIGNREFDLAWAVLPRPGQSIFYSRKEEEKILEGYVRVNDFNFDSYKYYRAMLIPHFLKFAGTNTEFAQWARAEMYYLTKVRV